MLQVLGGEENLRGVQPWGASALLYDSISRALPDGGGGLKLGQVGGTTLPAEPADAGGDAPLLTSATLRPSSRKPRELIGDGVRRGRRPASILTGEDAAADLHHNGVGGVMIYWRTRSVKDRFSLESCSLMSSSLWEGSLTPNRRCVATATCRGERNRRRRRLHWPRACHKLALSRELPLYRGANWSEE